MSKLEKDELLRRIEAMSVEEKKLALTVLPSELLLEELSRRDKANCDTIRDTIAGIFDLVNK